MRSENEVERAIDLYSDTVKRICVLHLKNSNDTEDIFQEVFLKYALSSVDFESDEHEKAWLIRVNVNQCKDTVRSIMRRKTVPVPDLSVFAHKASEKHGEVLEAILSLPEKYRRVIYLFYYEGYSAPEIGKMLGKNTNTVYTLLSRARDRLKERLENIQNG